MIPDYDRAARLACKTLLALHIDALPVDPLMILRFCKNTVIRTYDEITPMFGMSDPAHFKYYIMESKDALTVRREYNGAVRYELLYDSHGNPLRRRFTLAHELGHIVMKHAQEAPFEEKEADYFASQLLAPRPLFPLLTRNGLNASDPSVIAHVFILSKAASEIAVQPPRHHPDEYAQQLQRQFEPFIRSHHVPTQETAFKTA